ncbi:MAG: Gfo/Idh/MocA family oxidoreductase [Myxococcota bacterium]|nr:Gfo/Idh/MocA family oxidoreductase [Myxococcota bacterium]
MKVAVVGAGRIALEHFGALTALGDVDVVVCDRSPVAAAHAADRFGLRATYVDSDEMLRFERPDVVHVTTPAPSHPALARAALESGAHVLVEKPIAMEYADWVALRELATEKQRWLLEDYSYQFSPPMSRVLSLVEEGTFGDVVHVEVMICLDIHGEGSGFSDPNLPHPALALPGGALSDFLTHLAYLARVFIGDHRSVTARFERRDEGSLSRFDALHAHVVAEKATADLMFTAASRPDGFFVTVHGTRMRAHMNLFENTLRLDRVWPGPSPLTPLWNGLSAAFSEARGSLGSLVTKLSGKPGATAGVWELVRRTQEALRRGGDPPISLDDIDGVNRLVRDLLAELPS